MKSQQRKEILKNMKKRKKQLREEEIDRILADVDSTKDDSKMFRATKSLHTKRKQIQFVHDEKGKSVSNPQEIYETISKYFKNQFNKPNQNIVNKFSTLAKQLKRPITAAEVKRAIRRMSNNKAPGKDDIYIEMISMFEDHYPETLKACFIINGNL